MKPILVNLFAGPGAGKSTMAAHLFAELKWRDIEVEFALEFAKDLVWEDRMKTLENQLYVFSKQYHRIRRVYDQVDIVICDSPLPLSAFYQPKDLEQTCFEDFVFQVFNQFNNLNFFVNRQKKYHPNGRLQSEDEIKDLDFQLKTLLINHQIPFEEIYGNRTGVSVMTQTIINQLNNNTIK